MLDLSHAAWVLHHAIHRQVLRCHHVPHRRLRRSILQLAASEATRSPPAPWQPDLSSFRPCGLRGCARAAGWRDLSVRPASADALTMRRIASEVDYSTSTLSTMYGS